MTDEIGAFCPHGDIRIAGAATGPLAGLTLAVKDLFDIEGHTAGCGNPDWLASHGPAGETAPTVTALMKAGATLVGKTITDELAFSLNGENFHYGTPVNVAAPGRIPGGSSSGSAAAVAAGLADLALGTDTGGSVRAPASYCGLFGMRPSHGAMPLDGVMPLAPSFDTVGWFARDAALLQRAGDVLLALGPHGAADDAAVTGSVLYGMDAFDRALDEARPALDAAAERVGRTLGPLTRVTVAEDGLASWLAHFQALQWREIWRTHVSWITAHRPRFGPAIQERFDQASRVTDAAVDDAATGRAAVRARLADLLPAGTILVLPTVPSIAPPMNQPPDEAVRNRQRALAILCIAGLGGLPQISLPLATVRDCPVGLSLIGPAGSDRMLLAAARRVAEAI
ncbi:MAG: amidase [Inquilinaceae bacterium]